MRACLRKANGRKRKENSQFRCFANTRLQWRTYIVCGWRGERKKLFFSRKIEICQYVWERRMEWRKNPFSINSARRKKCRIILFLLPFTLQLRQKSGKRKIYTNPEFFFLSLLLPNWNWKIQSIFSRRKLEELLLCAQCSIWESCD